MPKVRHSETLDTQTNRMQQLFLEAINLSELVDLESFSGWYVIWAVIVNKTKEFIKIQIYFPMEQSFCAHWPMPSLPSTQKHPNKGMLPPMTFELWQTFCLTKLWLGSYKLSFEIGFNPGPSPFFDPPPSALKSCCVSLLRVPRPLIPDHPWYMIKFLITYPWPVFSKNTFKSV